MNDVKRIAFSEFGKVIAGQHIPAEQYNGDEGGTPYLTGPADFTDRIPHVTKWTNHPRSFAESGDVLLTVKGAGCGKSNLGLDAAIGRQLMALRPNKAKLDRNYLFAFIRSQEVRICALGRGATVPGISKRDIEKLHIPCFPLPEQRRIAAILDKADAIRRKREEVIRLTEDLLRSTFLETFGDPATNPKKWPTRAMGEVVEGTQYGTAEKSNSDGTGLPVLRMNNITYFGETDLTDLKWCEIKDADLEQLTVKRGDLLFNRTNSPELVGKTAVWDRDECYAFAGYLFRVRFHQNMVLPDYVSGFLNSVYGKKMLFAKAKPSNNMSNFSAGEFCRIELPIPEIGVQRRYTKAVAEIKKLKGKRMAGLKDATDLFGSLVQRAFRGEL